MKYQRVLTGVAAVTLAAALAAPASAAVKTSQNGLFQVGVGENGELYDAGAGVGLRRVADGYDPIAPGTPRDSWGINSVAADGQFLGSTVASTNNMVGVGGEAITDTGIGFTIRQNYTFVGGGNILRIDALLSNDTTGALDAIFQRNVDWDIGGSETVFGPVGAANGVVDSSYFGFESPDPFTPYNFSCYFGCNASGDLGGGIKINLGTLQAGGLRSFTYFYGLNREGTDVNTLIADAQAAGAKYILAAQGDDGNSAIIGISGAVPEPATWAMMLAGFFGLGSMVRRRRAALA
jgi:hypothetical protein